MNYFVSLMLSSDNLFYARVFTLDIETVKADMCVSLKRSFSYLKKLYCVGKVNVFSYLSQSSSSIAYTFPREVSGKLLK